MPREATLFESADGSVVKGYRANQRGLTPVDLIPHVSTHRKLRKGGTHVDH